MMAQPLPALQRRPETAQDKLVKAYLRQHSPVFEACDDLNEEVWADPNADRKYELNRQRLRDSCTTGDQSKIFGIYGVIVTELVSSFTNPKLLEDGVSGKSTPRGECLGTSLPINVLDICMAPGGFAKIILDRYKATRVYGLSLPPSQGGHPLIESQFVGLQNRFEIQYLDITMLAAEFDCTDILSEFSNERPYLRTRFDLIIADGAVLESHERSQYRTKIVEGVRLRASELVIALQRIKPGGTFVMLLHHMDAWETVQILHDFQTFATVQVKKPTSSHKASSSFYMIAEDVKPVDPAALAFVQKWKSTWREISLGLCRLGAVSQSGNTVDAIELKLAGLNIHSAQATDTEVNELLKSFGSTLLELGTPIWKTQIEGLHGKIGRKAFNKTPEQSRRLANEGTWSRGARQGSLAQAMPGNQEHERRGSLRSDTSSTVASSTSHDSEKSQAIRGDWNINKDAGLAKEAQARKEKADAQRALEARIQEIKVKSNWRSGGKSDENKVDPAGLIERAGNVQAKK